MHIYVSPNVYILIHLLSQTVKESASAYTDFWESVSYIVSQTVLNNQSLNLPTVFITNETLLRVPQPIHTYIHVIS